MQYGSATVVRYWKWVDQSWKKLMITGDKQNKNKESNAKSGWARPTQLKK